MSTLSSTSTLTEVKAAYFDNASYAEDSSPTKAAAFITACRFLLIYLPKRARQGQRHEIEIDVDQVRQELLAAKQWLAANAADSGAVRHADFTGFRD